MFLVEELMVGSLSGVLYQKPFVPLPLLQACKVRVVASCGIGYM